VKEEGNESVSIMLIYNPCTTKEANLDDAIAE